MEGPGKSSQRIFSVSVPESDPFLDCNVPKWISVTQLNWVNIISALSMPLFESLSGR